jgi:hypothetical protein
LFACDADSIPDDDANRDDADHNAGSAGLRSLLVRDPYASQLLDGDCAATRRSWALSARDEPDFRPQFMDIECYP